MENMENSNQSAPAGVKKDKLMGVLAYLGILIIIPYLVAKNDPFVKFHIKQGLVLLSIEFIAWIFTMIIWPLWMLFGIIRFIIFVFIVIGVINVLQGRERKLPLVGDYDRFFNI